MIQNGFSKRLKLYIFLKLFLSFKNFRLLCSSKQDAFKFQSIYKSARQNSRFSGEIKYLHQTMLKMVPSIILCLKSAK